MAPSDVDADSRRRVNADAVREQIRALIVESGGVGAKKHAFDAPQREIAVRRWGDDAIVVQQGTAVEELVVHLVARRRSQAHARTTTCGRSGPEGPVAIPRTPPRPRERTSNRAPGMRPNPRARPRPEAGPARAWPFPRRSATGPPQSRQRAGVARRATVDHRYDGPKPDRQAAADRARSLGCPNPYRYGVLRNTSLRVTVRRFRSRMMSTSCG